MYSRYARSALLSRATEISPSRPTITDVNDSGYWQPVNGASFRHSNLFSTFAKGAASVLKGFLKDFITIVRQGHAEPLDKRVPAAFS